MMDILLVFDTVGYEDMIYHIPAAWYDDMIDIDYSYAHLVRVSQRKSRLPSYYLRLQQEYY